MTASIKTLGIPSAAIAPTILMMVPVLARVKYGSGAEKKLRRFFLDIRAASAKVTQDRLELHSLGGQSMQLQPPYRSADSLQ